MKKKPKPKSLRDEFAMAALTGIVGKTPIVENSGSTISEWGRRNVAGAYEYAMR